MTWKTITDLADKQFEEVEGAQQQFVLLFNQLSRAKFRLLLGCALSMAASTKRLSEDNHIEEAVNDELQSLLEATDHHRKMEYSGGRFQI